MVWLDCRHNEYPEVCTAFKITAVSRSSLNINFSHVQLKLHLILHNVSHSHDTCVRSISYHHELHWRKHSIVLGHSSPKAQRSLHSPQWSRKLFRFQADKPVELALGSHHTFQWQFVRDKSRRARRPNPLWLYKPVSQSWCHKQVDCYSPLAILKDKSRISFLSWPWILFLPKLIQDQYIPIVLMVTVFWI